MNIIKTFFNSVVVLFFSLSPISILAQTIDANYLNPKFHAAGAYEFLRFGDASNFYAGFMRNEGDASHGDGDDFSIFTYGNRDITVRTLTGNFIVFPSSGGKVGIGTTNPQEKLEVKGKIYLNSGLDDYGIYWARHNMTTGTIPGSYNHNVFRLMPGGSSNGFIHSKLDMFVANSETSNEHKVRIHTSGNSFLMVEM